MKSSQNKGFTLAEVMFATAILLIALVALLGAYYHFYILSETLKGTTIAIGDARKVLEEIRATSYNSLSAITGTNWTIWAGNNGCVQLADEVVTVTFSGTDPLNTVIDVTWLQKSRQRNITITTLVTVR